MISSGELYLSLCASPGGSESEESACNARDPGSIPESGRSPREGNGNPLQYSCLENSMNRGDWLATVYGIAESDATESSTVQSMGLQSQM